MERVYIFSHCLASVWSGESSRSCVNKRLCLLSILWAVFSSGSCQDTSLPFHASSSTQGTSSTQSAGPRLLSSAAASLDILPSSQVGDLTHITEYLQSRNVLSGTVQLTAVQSSVNGVSLEASQTGDFPVLGTLSTQTLAQQTASVDTSAHAAPTPLLASTVFLDSVAPSVRWNPLDFVSDISPALTGPQAPTLSFQASATVLTTTGTVSAATADEPPSARYPSNLSLFQPSPSTVILLNTVGGSRTEVDSSDPNAYLTISISHSQTLHLVSDMVDTNSTVQPTFSEFVTISSTVESVSGVLTTPPPAVSSPGGNTSCNHDSSGCVEYHGTDSGDDMQMKVIIGVVCGAVAAVTLVAVVVGCLCRRRGKMSSGSKIDLSSYWDDSVTLSYINGHVDIPKDSGDEMISLDNDSFLNSLDSMSMSFSNTWTSDSSKHTIF